MAETKAEKEIKKEEKAFIKAIRGNPWIIATIVLAIAAIVLVVFMFKGGVGGISEKTMGENAITFFNTQLSSTPGTLSSVSVKNGVYEVMIAYSGKTVPVYFTKSGEFIAQGSGLVPTVASTAATGTVVNTPAEEVPKTDKPKVDLYIFSYCPYGTQEEKALVPVYNLMKTKVDFNLVFIGAMHGEYEKTESLRQIAIQKVYSKDKLFAYLDKFLSNVAIGDCNGDEACLAPLLDSAMKSVGIAKADIDSSMKSQAVLDIYDADGNTAANLGFGSSPTLTINGVEVSVARSPAAIQAAICDAFNNAPSECSQTLSSTAASPGFGSSAGSATAAAASCA